MSNSPALVPPHARLLMPGGHRHEIAIVEGGTVAELVAAVPMELQPYVHAYLNGTPVRDWTGTRLRAGDNVLLCVVPQGGGGRGGAKGVIGAILTIAVAVFAPYAATAIYGAMGGTLVAANAGLVIAGITAGVTLVGTMVVSALIGPPKVNTGAQLSGANAGTPTSYSLTGQSNAARPFGACFVLYGRHKVIPPAVSNVDVNNVGTSSILSAVYDFGLGYVVLDDFRIGDTPVATFNTTLNIHADSYCRDLTLAGQLIGYDQYSLTLQQNVPVVLRTKPDTITGTLVIVFSKGIFEARSKTGQAPYHADFRAQWRKVGDSTWIELPPDAYKGVDSIGRPPNDGLQWRIPNTGWQSEQWVTYNPATSPAQMQQRAEVWRSYNPSGAQGVNVAYTDAQYNGFTAFTWQGVMDEVSYFTRYPDIRAAGWTRPAMEHFEVVGSREGRDPGVGVLVDMFGFLPQQQYSPATTPTQLHAFDKQKFPSNKLVGAWGWIAEGRTLPVSAWKPVVEWNAVNGFDFNEQAYLDRYPDVAAAAAAGTTDAWTHFSQTGAWEARDPYGGQLPVRLTHSYAGPYTINLIFQFQIPGEYEIQVMRTDKIEDGSDTSIIASSGGEIQARYNEAVITMLKSGANGLPVLPKLRHTMVEMRVQASEQLQGAVQNFSAVATSVLWVSYDGVNFSQAATRNPAWIALDMLTSEKNPRPVPWSQIDMPSWIHLANVCDTLRTWVVNGQPYTAPRYTCDIVVDTFTTVRDLVESVLSGCRASLVLTTAGLWGVLHDEEKTIPRQLITPANSWGFSGLRTFSARPHGFHVAFVNRDRGWQKDQCTVYADGYNASNATEFETLDTYGITDYAHAWAFGRYMMAQGLMRAETFTLTMDVENLLVQRGDLVRVAHDVPLMGGLPTRIDALSAQVGPNGGGLVHCNLDLARAATGYCVRLSDGTVRTGRVWGNLGEGVFELDTTAGLAVDDLLVLGDYATETQPYLVQQIGPGSNLTAVLTLVRYVPGIYTADIGALPEWEAGITPPLLTGTDLVAYEPTEAHVLYYVQRMPRVDVNLAWKVRGTSLSHYEVALITQDGRRRVLADFVRTPWWKHVVAPLEDPELIGTTLTYEITPVSALGYRGTGCTIAAVLQGDETAPGPVLTLGANVQKETVDVWWNPPDEPDISHYLVRYTPETVNPNWEASHELANVAWPATKVAVGARTGSYGVVVVDTSGHYSTAVWRRTTVAVLPDINVVTVLNDRDLYPTPWPGQKVNVEAWGDEIRTAGTWGTYQMWGYYYFDAIVDLGQVYETRVASLLEAHGEIQQDMMDQWPVLSEVQQLASSISALWACWLEVRTSDEQAMMADWPALRDIDPIAGTTEGAWSAWRVCHVGDYTAQLFQFRIVMLSRHPDLRVVCTTGRVEVDMPDRVDTYGDVQVPAAGLDFAFAVPFRVLQSLGITIDGNVDPVVAEVTNKSATGFHVALRHTVNASYVAGQVDVMAEGYGRQRLTSI